MEKIDSISAEIEEFHESIKPIQALLGGTPTMRKAGEAYMPKFDLEENDKEHGDRDYKKRLKVATLVPYFGDTVKSMTGRIFYKPFNIDKIHEKIKAYKDDFDGFGSSLDDTMESVFFEALALRRSFVVVDYTATTKAETVQEEKESGARPYAFKVEASQVMDVRFNRDDIVLFKYKHRVINEEETDDFNLVYRDEIVLMTPGVTRKYWEEKGGWYEVSRNEIEINSKTPTKVLAAELNLAKEPPLQNLAELNIKHWQSQSDQDNILNKARVPILKVTGVDDPGSVIITGAMFLPANSDANYIEHTGKAIEAGQKSLDKLEEQMAVAGSRLLMRTKMAFTDQQAKDENLKEVSELMLYGGMLNKFIMRVLSMFGEWLQIDDVGEFDLTQNLENTIDSGVPMSEVILMSTHNIISKETVYETAKVRGVIPDSGTFKDEQEKIDLENEAGFNRAPSALM